MKPPLRYGNVIAFEYLTAEVTAMVIGASADGNVFTDEGTCASPRMPNRIIVYGLTRSTAVRGVFHEPGGTATFDTDANTYEVLE